ncbi:MAG: nuclear transport factor 2 family protein [Actinomycetota bacterium]|nr:nuclear transport factor 2 family protein [Actinomycetota bacterium]
MPITETDLVELANLLDEGRDAWIHGRLQWESDNSATFQPDDATIFGPFGGIAPKVVAPRVQPEVQRTLAARFGGGTGLTEVVRTIVEGDLVVVVYVDRSSVRFDGSDDETPWMLRVTEVFRKQPDGWFRLHRHADPLVRYRDLDATRKLLD